MWKLEERGSRLLPPRSHGVVQRDFGNVGWGSLWYPDVIRLSKGRRSPGKGTVAWAGRRQTSRNLGGKASTEVGRRSLRPSEVRRRGGEREEPGSADRGRPIRPRGPCSTFFLRTWARGSPRREVILGGLCSRTPGPATTPTPIDPTGPRTWICPRVLLGEAGSTVGRLMQFIAAVQATLCFWGPRMGNVHQFAPSFKKRMSRPIAAEGGSVAKPRLM